MRDSSPHIELLLKIWEDCKFIHWIIFGKLYYFFGGVLCVNNLNIQMNIKYLHLLCCIHHTLSFLNRNLQSTDKANTHTHLLMFLLTTFQEVAKDKMRIQTRNMKIFCTHNIIQDQVIIRQYRTWTDEANQLPKRENSFTFRWYLRYDAITIKAFSFICFSLLLDHKWSSNALLWNSMSIIAVWKNAGNAYGFSVEDKNVYCYYVYLCVQLKARD